MQRKSAPKYRHTLPVFFVFTALWWESYRGEGRVTKGNHENFESHM